MDILKSLALPQSLEHYQLVILLAAISSLVFIPYLGFALGSSTISYWLNRRGRRTGSVIDAEIAHTLADIAFYNKSVVAFFGLIPGLSLVFSLAQILQSTPSQGVSFGGTGFIFILLGLWLLYGYRYTFRVQGIIEAYEAVTRKGGDGEADGIAKYGAQNARAHMRFGKYGLIFTYIGAFLYVASIAATINPVQWTQIASIWDALWSAEVWLRFLQFLAVASAATGIGGLYFGLSWTSEHAPLSDQAGSYLRSLSLRLSAASFLILPLLVIGNLAMLSSAAQGGWLYAFAGLGIIFLFFAANFLYGFHTSGQMKAVGYSAMMFLIASSSIVTTEYAAVGRATKDHAAVLAFMHGQSLDALRAKLGVNLVTFTGQDIFDAKCSACHQFEEPKVGPPYIDVLPKYDGKKDELMSFVMRPVKVDPNYPSMPSQGLKPAEADSIASYLLRLYSERSKQTTPTP